MRLVTQLGLEPDGHLLRAAAHRWTHWQETHPELAVCEVLEDLPQRIQVSSKGKQNALLLALAQLGAVDGADDPIAAGVLCWLLLPGAARIAAALSPSCYRIDEVVAAQLWISVRTVTWRQPIKVAATVLMNTRREVVDELYGPNLRQAREFPSDALEDAAGWCADQWSSWPGDSAADYLYDVLEAAVSDEVMTRDEAGMLLRLAEVSHATNVRSRTGGGLFSRAVAHRVGAESGVSAATVARRAQDAISRLQAAHEKRLLSA